MTRAEGTFLHRTYLRLGSGRQARNAQPRNTLGHLLPQKLRFNPIVAATDTIGLAFALN